MDTSHFWHFHTFWSWFWTFYLPQLDMLGQYWNCKWTVTRFYFCFDWNYCLFVASTLPVDCQSCHSGCSMVTNGLRQSSAVCPVGQCCHPSVLANTLPSLPATNCHNFPLPQSWRWAELETKMGNVGHQSVDPSLRVWPKYWSFTAASSHDNGIALKNLGCKQTPD